MVAVLRGGLKLGWLGLALLLLAGGVASARGGLRIGDPAPDFRLQGSDGAWHELGQYRGRTAVVIAWFPRPFGKG